MAWVQLIITIAGLVGLGVYQHYKIKGLQDQVSSQNELLNAQKNALEGVKIYADIFQPEQLKEFVQIREETIEMQKNIEIEKIKSKFEEKQLKAKDNLKLAVDFLIDSVAAVSALTYYVGHDKRKDVLANMTFSSSLYKNQLTEMFNETPYHGDLFRELFKMNIIKKIGK